MKNHGISEFREGATHWCKQRGSWLKAAVEKAGISQELLALCHGERASSQQGLDCEVSS